MKNFLGILCTTLALALTAIACTSERDGVPIGTGETEAEIELALSFIPRENLDFDGQTWVRLQFVDNLRETSWWNADEQGENSDQAWLFERIVTLGPVVKDGPLFQAFAMNRYSLFETDAFSKSWGYSLDETSLAARSLYGPPIVVGSFDYEAIENALEADPIWSKRLRYESSSELFYWNWGEEADFEAPPSPGRSQLGFADLFIDDGEHAIVRTEGTIDFHTALAAHAGDNNLSGDQNLIELLTAMHAAKAIGVTFLDEQFITTASTSAETVPEIGWIAFGQAIDLTPGEPGSLELIGATFASSEDAQRAAEQIERSLDGPIDGVVLREQAENIDVEVHGASVLVSAERSTAELDSELLQSLFNDD